MIAFAADLHADWKWLYDEAEKRGVTSILVLGDAEPVRSEADLKIIPAPKKYLKKGDFELFWREKRVPVPTYVLLGNHEPFLWLDEIERKGPFELIENFWILNRSGVIEVEGLKVAYLSRIFSPKVYFGSKRFDPKRHRKSKLAGAFTPEDVEKLLSEVSQTDWVDILALHENPTFVKDERGRQLYRDLICLIKPKRVVCGHMHESLKGEVDGVEVIGIGRYELLVQSSL